MQTLEFVNGLLSLKDAGEITGITRYKVGLLVRAYSVPFVRIPHSRALGLDEAGMLALVDAYQQYTNTSAFDDGRISPDELAEMKAKVRKAFASNPHNVARSQSVQKTG